MTEGHRKPRAFVLDDDEAPLKPSVKIAFETGELRDQLRDRRTIFMRLL